MNAPFDRTTISARAGCRDDLHAWAREQAALPRAGRLAELDDVASEQDDKLESALRVLLTHVPTWDYQPERIGASLGGDDPHAAEACAPGVAEES